MAITLTNSERVKLKVEALKAGLSPNLTDDQLIAIRDGKTPVSASTANEADAVAAIAADQVLEVVRASVSHEVEKAKQALDAKTRAAEEVLEEFVHQREGIANKIEAIYQSSSDRAEELVDKAVAGLVERIEEWRADTSVELDESKRQATEAATIARTVITELSAQLAEIDNIIKTTVEEGFAHLRSAVITPEAEAKVLEVINTPRCIARETCAKVFGVPILDADGKHVEVEVWNHPNAPEIDFDYFWDKEALAFALIAQDEASKDRPGIGGNVWLAGERGTGKTQFAQQFAARTGRQIVRINFDRHLERLDFIGSKGLENGQTVWQDGTFLKAFKVPGTVILLDEFGFANPANIANLQALLEPAVSVTYDGFQHTRAPGVVIFAADNSNGNADNSGRFAGVQEQNSALLDRFPYTVQFGFLPAKKEVDIVVAKTGVDRETASSIVALIREARAKTVTGDVVEPPSLRQGFALALAIKAGVSFKAAWTAAVVNKACDESRVALIAIGEAFWKEGKTSSGPDGSDD